MPRHISTQIGVTRMTRPSVAVNTRHGSEQTFSGASDVLAFTRSLVGVMGMRAGIRRVQIQHGWHSSAHISRYIYTTILGQSSILVTVQGRRSLSLGIISHYLSRCFPCHGGTGEV